MEGARLLFSLLSLFLLFPATFADDLNLPSHRIASSPFYFLKQFQGFRKGAKVDGIQSLKNYFERYGYLSYAGRNRSQANDDEFDDLLESAIKTYQIHYNLNATGVIDVVTMSQMMIPRCAVADIINGTTRMRSTMEMHDHNHGDSVPFHTVSHFFFNREKPKWDTSALSFSFNEGTKPEFFAAIFDAFKQWNAAKSGFGFYYEAEYAVARIKIIFVQGFQNGDLTHVYGPGDGRMFFNADKAWSLKPEENKFHLGTAALHAIGHVVGLGHSSVSKAIMYAVIHPKEVRGLDKDDIEAIQALSKS